MPPSTARQHPRRKEGFPPTMITEFTGKNLNALRAEIDAALATVATKHGITLKMGNAKYARGGEFFEAQLKGALVRDGQVVSKESVHFTQHASIYGLLPDDLGKEFVSHGRRFRITGLKSGASKRQILTESEGKNYVFPADAVVIALGRRPVRFGFGTLTEESAP